MKIYGPYKRKDGRSHVIYYDKGIRKTKSFPRHLWESLVGPIPFGYEVDHINNDPTDNRLENLQLLSVADNIRKSKKQRVYYELVCKHCGKLFLRYSAEHKRNEKSGRDGPFCSRHCVGKTHN